MVLESGLAVTPVPFAQENGRATTVLEKVMSAHCGVSYTLQDKKLRTYNVEPATTLAIGDHL